MIEANDFYFLTTARDIGVSPRHIQRLIKSFEGWRIYFRQRVGEKERIREYFRGLKIEKWSEFDKYFGQYPVLLVSFKEVKSSKFEESLEDLNDIISEFSSIVEMAKFFSHFNSS